MQTDNSNWWGTFEFGSGGVHIWRCADLVMQLECLPNQWRLDYGWQPEENPDAPRRGTQRIDVEAAGCDKARRFVFAQMPARVTLQPALADRPVVCRPVVPVSLLPYQQVTLYVCLPLWLQLMSQADILIDIPTVRVSDSWFGPNTREGVFSYASKVSEQLDVHPLADNHSRAVLEVQIHNHTGTMLTLDKISVPVPNLALFADGSGHFWTPRVTLSRQGEDNVIVSIDNEISCGLDESQLKRVAPPREILGRGKITKALSALFG